MSEGRKIVCPHCDAINKAPTDKPLDAANCGRCHKRLFEGEPVALDAARFARHVGNSDIPVIVDCWAAWCGPCRAIAPVFAQAAKALEPRARFVKVDVDANPELSAKLNIRSIPALFAFKGGRVVAQQAGLNDPNLFNDWVARFEQD